MIEIFWSDEDAGYIARIADLHNLSAVGDTEEQALKELQIARGGYFELSEELRDIRKMGLAADKEYDIKLEWK